MSTDLRNKTYEILSQTIYPETNKSINESGILKEVTLKNGVVVITYQLSSTLDTVGKKLTELTLNTLKDHGIDARVEIIRPKKVQGVNRMPNVKSFIMVTSGKGGVGKSTTVVNLALALKELGKTVGILDGDMYGPNISRMLGRPNDKAYLVDGKIQPLEAYGIKFISMANLLEEGVALIWRSSLIVKTLRQFMEDVNWGNLDVLLIDMPPGTGDAQLTMAQDVPITAGVAVTTPQIVSADDVKRSLNMFEKLYIPIAGIIENMNSFICPNCGTEHFIFGKGAGDELARQYNTHILARIPIVPEIREGGDKGLPILVKDLKHEASQRYIEAASELIQFVDRVLAENKAGNELIQPIIK